MSDRTPRQPPPDDPTAGTFAAHLACGCTLAFAPGVEGSPVTVVLAKKSDACGTAIHVAGLPLYDHREALRPSTRLLPPQHTDYEES